MIALVAALTVGLVMIAPPVPEAAASTVARQGDLTNRPAGLPATANPAQQLRSASVRQNLAGSTISGSFTLKASPPAAESDRGQQAPCRSTSVTTTTAPFSRMRASAGLRSRSPAIWPVVASRAREPHTPLSRATAAAGWSTWNCAYVAVLDENSTVVDGLVGNLSETHGKPAVAIKSVSLLGSARQPFPLVRGIWTTFEVELENTGASDARGVVVSGNGKGVRVTRTRVGAVSTSSGSTATVRVRLIGRANRAVVRLRVSRGGVAAGRLIRLKRIRPTRPVSGRYRDRAGNVTFRIRNGQVVGFKGKIQSQCGVWPQFTYNTQQWSFPRTKIRADGIVDRAVRRKNMRLDLRIRVAGRRATQGRFYYSDPGGYCHGSRFFTATRIGR